MPTHIRTGEPVALSRRVLPAFLLITVADFSDQYTDYQDGRLEFAGDNWGAPASRASGSAPCQGTKSIASSHSRILSTTTSLRE